MKAVHPQSPALDFGGVPTWLGALLLAYGEWTLWAILFARGFSTGWLWAIVLGLLGVLGTRLLVAAVVLVLARPSWREAPPEVRMSPGQALRLFVREYGQFLLAALVRLPFPWLFRSRGDRALARGEGLAVPPGARVVLLQHGYLNNGAVWWRMVRALEAAGHVVFTIDQPLYGPIEAYADRLAIRIDAVLGATGRTQLTLIGHSMGGLIIRSYLARYGAQKVDRVLTIGSPHHGSRLAFLALGENGRQMRPGSAFLGALNATALPTGVPFLSLWGWHDTLVLPPTSSRLAGAEERTLAGLGHVTQPGAVEVHAVVLDWLRANSAASASTDGQS
ncbi:MAG: alpha/beta fold hydrolase [Casimicrobiaceae bacterium]|nr:alpha/beta fold hydrolase [Casimicrobiaceae bacterium]